MLHTIDESLVYAFAKKIMSIYFDNGTHVYWDDIQMAFQKIKPYSPDRNSSLNSGWIHTDGARTFAGVVYLTPNAPTSGGTGFFRSKIDGSLTGTNHDSLPDGVWSDVSKWDKVAEVGNIYNRIVLFRADQWHTSLDYFGSGPEDGRLTQVFFIKTEQ